MDKPVEFPAPPSAEQRPFSYERHGVTIEDPWHWIRDPKYPEVTDAPQTDSPARSTSGYLSTSSSLGR